MKKEIYDLKVWKSITDKRPCEYIISLHRSEKLNESEKKFLAILTERDAVNIPQLFKKYRSLTTKELKGTNLERYILFYGEEEGLRKYNEKIKQCIHTLDTYIDRYGPVEGNLKYNIYKQKKINNLHNFIRRYGDVEGTKKYKQFCANNKGNHTLSRQISKHGEIEGRRRHTKNRRNLSLTHSIDGYISRHGEFVGCRKFHEKIKKLTTNNHRGYSQISQELFDKICSSIDIPCDFFYASHKGEIFVDRYKVDFCIPEYKIIIEFNGDRFHANPDVYSPNDMPHPFVSISSKDIWFYDKKRLEILQAKGYEVLTIWEKDYRSDREQIINKCVEVIRNEIKRRQDSKY
jgi:very-short-patch-repair endonuclease